MPRKRKQWSATEIRILKSYARRKIRTPKIAREMRRTPTAIRQKAFALGLSLETRYGVLIE